MKNSEQDTKSMRVVISWKSLRITLPHMSLVNKMAPSVFEWIFHAEHESGFKNFPSRHVFEKMGIANSKNGVFIHF